MPRIYLTGSVLGRGYITGSGIISNPARIILSTRDNATSSYPTVSRIGDPGRTGRYSTNFNDTNTIVFNNSVTTSFPSNLQPVNKSYISQSVATPNKNATIEAVGIVRKGVADANISFTPGEDLTPFIEDSLFASEPDSFKDPFYTTGSAVAAIGPGFTSPLRSKTKIEIDLTPNSSDIFGFISASIAYSSDDAKFMAKNPNVWPMVYYNFDEKKYQKIGYGMPSETIFGGSNQVGTDSMLKVSGTVGFSRGTELVSEGLRAQCRPISNFGFPSNARYHATSSHLYPLTGVLDSPFLVEKFVYEFKAAYGIGTDVSTRDAMFTASGSAIMEDRDRIGRASILTFFMLNQRGPMSASHTTDTVNRNYRPGGTSAYSIEKVLTTTTLPTTNKLTLNGESIFIDSYRDLVTYGQMTVFQPGAVDGTFMQGAISNGGLGRELNVNAAVSSTPLTGTFVMSGTVKTTPSYTAGPVYRISKWTDNTPDRLVISTQYQGTRSGIALSGNRGLTARVPGGEVTGSLRDFGVTGSGQGTTDSYQIQTFKSYESVSPYILKPTDNLIFGWQSPMTMGWERTADNTGSAYGTGPNMQIMPGSGKLTLYGSLVTDNHEHHPGLNQPLTSDAIHEFIGFHGPPLDQFDTEPRQQFSGSFTSTVVTGSITESRGIVGDRASAVWLAGNPSRVPFPNTGIIAQQAVIKNESPHRPGSFRRSIIAEEDGAIFYDSCTPDAFDVYNTDGKSYDITAAYGYGLWLGGPEAAAGGTVYQNASWPRIFPFEPRFSKINRTVSKRFPDKISVNAISLKSRLVGFGALYLPSEPLGNGHQIIQIALPYGDIMYGRPRIERTSSKVFDTINNILWGIGSGVSGTVAPYSCTTSYAAATLPEGYKYGLYHANFRSAYCQFRDNHYGQFRDMLEQRSDSRFFSQVSGRSTISDSPVSVRFISSDGTSASPNDTSSSNLSQFATSSLPYFDGIARNRNPIVTADLGLTIVSI